MLVRANPALLIPVAAAFSARQDNFAPTGYSLTSPYEYEIQCAITASAPIAGLQGGRAGRKVTLVNTSTDYLLWIEHEAASSTAANRFTLPDGFPAFLPPGDHITFIYRTGSSRWEVYSWPNRGVAMGLTTFEDFIGIEAGGAGAYAQMGSLVGGTVGTASAIGATVGTGIDTTEKARGIASLQTGTTTTGAAAIGGPRSAGVNTMVPAQGPALFVSRLQRPTATDGTDTYAIASGFHDGGALAITDGVFWEYRWTGSAEEWSQTRSAASSLTRDNGSSPTADATFIWLGIFMNAAWTRADYLWSQDSKVFTVAGSRTVGIPSNTQLVGAVTQILKSAGTTSRICNLDFQGMRYDQGARG